MINFTYSAIIPARRNSKRLKFKNRLQCGGMSLIERAIKSAIESDLFLNIIVTTDDEQIVELVTKEYSDDVVFVQRPEELATDTALSETVIAHALAMIQHETSHFMLLPPTSPLRTVSHLHDAVGEFENSRCVSLISVEEISGKSLKYFRKDDEGFLAGVMNNVYPFMPEQLLPSLYRPNGAIYIADQTMFQEGKTLLQRPCLPFLMSEQDSLDVDDLRDLDLANRILTNSFGE